MRAPENAVSLPTAQLWLDDGVVWVKSTGLAGSEDDVRNVLRHIETLTGGERRPILGDLREWPNLDTEGWAELFGLIDRVATGIALVVAPGQEAPIRSFVSAVSSLVVPAEVVSSESAGLEFLAEVAGRATDPIETTHTSVWLEDGIVRIRSKGNRSDGSTVAATIDAVRRLHGGMPGPVLFDARQRPRFDPEAWRTLIVRAREAFTRVAVLIDPANPPEFGEYVGAIDDHVTTMQVFTDEAAALEFAAS